jgi:hypothetical protein
MSGSIYRCRSLSKSKGSHGVFRHFRHVSRATEKGAIGAGAGTGDFDGTPLPSFTPGRRYQPQYIA